MFEHGQGRNSGALAARERLMILDKMVHDRVNFIAALLMKRRSILLFFVKAQSRSIVVDQSLVVNVLKVDSALIVVLDSLLQSEKKCVHYRGDLVWFVSIRNVSEKEVLYNATMFSLLGRNIRDLGYVDIDGVPFLFSGFKLSNLIESVGMDSIVLPLKQNIDVVTSSSPEDYSVWDFIYVDGSFLLQDSFALPCD